jgi:hypothetical protein
MLTWRLMAVCEQEAAATKKQKKAALTVSLTNVRMARGDGGSGRLSDERLRGIGRARSGLGLCARCGRTNARSPH